ncbi:TetR/AcrR family transcriptional regulator C-terminal domain-containing protein [Nocardia sp. NBC_01503]|uniref:TetR/AcrR family transcriptional regulator C-terminal domain-containing protein n=1 Tax=Nocardia sp. NBC_01503 TaxID=2975997 RepID=UPI002E7C1116|nr:TetR/AcrR family transcriptional regulator C-terminal domain-containing protein [Nocardia sp. NBC_01503]WTL31192.1 TetR/AcrR family transcriptional regulator C-terminal domain-containing protein [Nocardia sp. NBC_01503]
MIGPHENRTGLTEEQWRATVGPYPREAIATGEYPHFARRVNDAEDSSAAPHFEFGLGCLLEGVGRTVQVGGSAGA